MATTTTPLALTADTDDTYGTDGATARYAVACDCGDTCEFVTVDCCYHLPPECETWSDGDMRFCATGFGCNS